MLNKTKLCPICSLSINKMYIFIRKKYQFCQIISFLLLRCESTLNILFKQTSSLTAYFTHCASLNYSCLCSCHIVKMKTLNIHEQNTARVDELDRSCRLSMRSFMCISKQKCFLQLFQLPRWCERFISYQKQFRIIFMEVLLF